MTQRVKDVERFERDLGRPPHVAAGAAVTEQELERDAESFMAFASAFGVKPPSPSDEPATA